MMTPEAHRADLSFLAGMSRDLRRRRRSGLPKDGPAPVDLVQSLTEWLDEPTRGELTDLRRLAGPAGEVAGTATETDLTTQDWRPGALDAAVETLAGSQGLQATDPRLDDIFRSWETVVLVREGFTYAESVAIVGALPSIARARGLLRTSSARALGVSLLSLTLSLRDRIRVEFLPTDGLMKVLGRSRLLILLGAAIDADGHALEAFDPVVGNSIAQSVCSLSQMLADVRGAYEAAKGF